MAGTRRIGRSRAAVKVGGALLLALLALGVPRVGDAPPPAVWDVLAVIVSSVETEIYTARGRTRLSVTMDESDRALVRKELAGFRRRVIEGTSGRLEVRLRVVVVPGPITRFSGPGPHWLDPENAAKALRRVRVGGADTVMVFAKVGEDDGPGVPVSHLGSSVGGHRGPEGACFAGITFRPSWLDGTGTVALHEWLHGLKWALTEVAGFPEDAIPDPDEGRDPNAARPGVPRGDGPFADWIVRKRLTREMIRAADARRGPAVDDGYLRGWTLAGSPVGGAFRTVRLPAGVASAEASLPESARGLEVFTESPVLVRLDEGPQTRVDRRAKIERSGKRVRISSAVGGTEVRFRVRALR